MRITLNCAMSADGKVALPSRRQTKISNREDVERVHRMRNEVDAILVGIGTVLADDPKLTVSEKHVDAIRKQPLRIVLDSNGRTPRDAQVLNGMAKTLIVTNERCGATFPNADTFRTGDKRVDLQRLVDHLEKMNIKRLMIEGGGAVIWSFIKEGLADEISVFIGSVIIGGEESPTMAEGEGFGSIDEMCRLTLIGCERLGDGVLIRYEVAR